MTGTTASGWPYITEADEPKDFDVPSKALADKLEADVAAKVHTHALADLPTTLATDTEVAAAITAHTDTDASPTAKHHTLGTGANQAAAGSHTHALDNLSDVSTGGATSGQSLVYTGSTWGPGTVGTGGGATTLDGLTDVVAPTPADGDALVWDAATSKWIPGEVAAGGGDGDGDAEPATGGTITDVGGYRIHTFTESGSLVAPDALTVDVLLVGGGGGAGYHRGGGGGAGGFLTQPGVAVTPSTYSIVIGTGGGVITDADGANGGNTTALGFTAIGGGGGGNVPNNGKAGGSGGGGAATNNEGTNTGGAGTSGQGYAGGTHGDNDATGGGGGAGGSGAGGAGQVGGLGGIGVQSSYSGTAKWYAGGGGGGGRTTGGAGGSGVGGMGAGSGATQVAPVANSGSGGAGRFDGGAATAGAAGVVIVRYLYTPEEEPLTADDLVAGEGIDLDKITTPGSIIISSTGSGSGGGGGAYVLGNDSTAGARTGLTINRQNAQKITIASSSLLVSVDVYCDNDNTGNPFHIGAALWEDTAGVPSKLIAFGPLPINNPLFWQGPNPRWLSLPMSRVLAPGDYWISFYSADTTGVSVFSTTGAAGSSRYWTGSGAWIHESDAPGGTPQSSSTTLWSMRAVLWQ